MPERRIPLTVTPEIRAEAVARLQTEGLSCVIVSADGETTLCRERGVKDLYRILTSAPSILDGAFVADKVVGKGAAALMIEGGVAEVWTAVISRPALHLFEDAGVKVDYADCVPNIINRASTGICPVERLCAACSTAAECIPLIGAFLAEMQSSQTLKK